MTLAKNYRQLPPFVFPCPGRVDSVSSISRRQHIVAAHLFRISFFIYWAAFAVFTAHQGQFPGFGVHLHWQYPYAAVVEVCTLLALKLLVLYLILPAAHFPWNWRRLVAALIYSALLLFFSGAFAGLTDQPAYYYVPATFSQTTFCCVLALSVVSIGSAVLGRGNSAA